MYEYNASLVRVIDGDTYEFRVDLGFGASFVEKFRLYGADTPEVYGKYASEEGRTVSAVVKRIFAFNDPVLTIKTFKDKKGKYGRYLVDVLITVDEDGDDSMMPVWLSQYLIDSGYAEEM